MKPASLPVFSSEKDQLRVTEIFFSIQGESTHTGLPCVLVRLTGCNLRCQWCDTDYSFTGGDFMSLDAIVSAVKAYPTRRVELTGGEPLLQKATPRLAQKFLELGYTVLCETSGERDISILPAGVCRIMDIKAPGSGESDRNRWENIEYLNEGDEVKFVCSDRRDFEWMLDVVRKHKLETKVPILVSPSYHQLEARVLAEWLLESGLDARLNLQLHKVLWGESPGR